jgi:hypothetical protein
MLEPDALKGARPVVCPANGYVDEGLDASGSPCSARLGCWRVQHNQSASRNARSVSDGRYLPGLVPSGEVRAIACSLRAGSACS